MAGFGDLANSDLSGILNQNAHPAVINAVTDIEQSNILSCLVDTSVFSRDHPDDVATFGADENTRQPPIYVSDDLEYALGDFLVPFQYRDTLQSIMIPHGLIQDRVIKLAHDIRHAYSNITVHLMCVLKGGSTFFSDLLRCLQLFHDYNDKDYVPFTFDFIKVKSYVGTESSGTVRITGGDITKLEGKHILLVEDIVDTGRTMSLLIPTLKAQGPASVKCASLLEKRTPKSCGYKADFVGFSIPEKFVVGYCLDYNEMYRDFKHIGVLNEIGIERYAIPKGLLDK